MKLFAALLIIVFLAFSGYHLSFRKIRLPLIARGFYMTGIEYLLLGFLLGPRMLNLLDSETLTNLEPLSALLLGWVGFLCGFQCELKSIRQFSRAYFYASLTDIVITFAVVFMGAYLCLPQFFALTGNQRLVLAIGFSAAATCTSQTGLALLTSATLRKRSHLVNFLRYLCSMSAIGALVLFSAIFSIKPVQEVSSGHFLPSPVPIISILVTNLTLVLLYNLFLAQRKTKNELSLILTGMVIITSGAASALDFSPLLANFTMGAILVNTRREKERLFNLLIWAEKPLYLLLLVFLGATWALDSVYAIPLALGLVLLRFSGKLVAGVMISSLIERKENYPPGLGLGLIEQGGVPLAIYFDMNQMFHSPLVAQMTGIAIIALIISDLASPRLMDTLLNNSSAETSTELTKIHD